jgi:hypothetical protein
MISTRPVVRLPLDAASAGSSSPGWQPRRSLGRHLQTFRESLQLLSGSGRASSGRGPLLHLRMRQPTARLLGDLAVAPPLVVAAFDEARKRPPLFHVVNTPRPLPTRRIRHRAKCPPNSSQRADRCVQVRKDNRVSNSHCPPRTPLRGHAGAHKLCESVDSLRGREYGHVRQQTNDASRT